MDKEVTHNFYSRKYVGWNNLIQDIYNSLHEVFLVGFTSKMELGAN